MSDYIEQEKKRLNVEAARQERTERVRLHDAYVIRAKAPDLWNAAIQKLKADCQRCAATFPNDGQRNPVLTEKPDGFELRNSDFPRRIYNAELRVAGYLVKVKKVTQLDQFTPGEPVVQEDIRVEVGSSDIAQYFIGAVCQFRQYP